MVSAVVLAAGRATRMGEPKQLLKWKGGPLLGHVLAAASGSTCDEIVVVLGYAADDVRRAVTVPAKVVVNPEFATGQASSLRIGLDACDDRAEAAVVLLGDQPEVTAAAIDDVVKHWQEGKAKIVRARYSERVGHPVLLTRAVWDEVTPTGDEGARTVIAAHPEIVDEVRVAGRAPMDVDSPADYRALIERGAQR